MATAATITPADIGQAAEALNRMPGLSPAARRVGQELLSHTNRVLGVAWPGERRMAEALGYDRRTIGRAKKELAAAGVLRWERRGRKTALYVLALEALAALARKLARKVKDATSKRLKGQGSAHDHKPVQRAPEPQRWRPLRLFNGTFSSPNIPQNRFKMDGGREKTPRQTSSSIVPDEILDRKAHGRLWEGIRGCGAEFMTAVMLRDNAAELEAQAVKAERYRPGAGIAVLLDLLRK
jgi:hypothetical protein